MVLSAKLRLMRDHGCAPLVMMGYPDMYVAADEFPPYPRHRPIPWKVFDRKLG